MKLKLYIVITEQGIMFGTHNRKTALSKRAMLRSSGLVAYIKERTIHV